MTNKTNSPIFFSFLLVAIGHFLVDMMIGIWPVYKTMAHLDLTMAGIVGALCSLFGEGFQVLFGSMSDRGYRKGLILFGIIATTASTFLVYTNYYGLLFALFLITCLGSGAFHPSAASLVSDLPYHRKGLLVALFASAGAFGMASSQLIFINTHQWFDSHTVFLAIPPLLLVGFALFKRVQKTEVTTQKTKHFDLKIYKSFFQHKPLRSLYFFQVCNATMVWGSLFLLPDFLVARGYPSTIALGGGHMAFVLGSALMMISAGYLTQRFSSRYVLLGSSLSSLILLYLILGMPLLGNIGILILLFCLGSSLGIASPVAIILGCKLAPEHRGRVNAFLMGMVWCISESIGQAGGGFLADSFAVDAPAKALACLGGFVLIAAFMAAQLPQDEESAIFVESM